MAAAASAVSALSPSLTSDKRQTYEVGGELPSAPPITTAFLDSKTKKNKPLTALEHFQNLELSVLDSLKIDPSEAKKLKALDEAVSRRYPFIKSAPFRTKLLEIHQAEKEAAMDPKEYTEIGTSFFNLPIEHAVDYLELRSKRANLNKISNALTSGKRMTDILTIPKLSAEDIKRTEDALNASIRAGNKELNDYFKNKISLDHCVSKTQYEASQVAAASPLSESLHRTLKKSRSTQENMFLAQEIFAVNVSSKPIDKFFELEKKLHNKYESHSCNDCNLM